MSDVVLEGGGTAEGFEVETPVATETEGTDDGFRDRVQKLSTELANTALISEDAALARVLLNIGREVVALAREVEEHDRTTNKKVSVRTKNVVQDALIEDNAGMMVSEEVAKWLGRQDGFEGVVISVAIVARLTAANSLIRPDPLGRLSAYARRQILSALRQEIKRTT